jgi:NAD(P)-dependent dehydrogenase (short-subunit alcohol dehydrogenase family)
MPSRVALITGASSGIGQACAVLLAQRAFRVYGTSRHPRSGDQPFTMLPMDVTDQNSVERGVNTILDREGRIDVLVNNAGIAIAGPLESTSLEEARHQIDVNLLGAFRLCRAVLPIMRSRRDGYIVNISSIGGLIAIPYQPLYSASKFAMEGMMESLRLEVRRFGIRVVLIEPGDTKTPITQNRTLTANPAARNAYPSFAAALQRTATDEQNGPGPDSVARLVCRVVNTSRPRLRYTTGPTAQRAAVWMKRLLPNSVLEYGMRRYYGT